MGMKHLPVVVFPQRSDPETESFVRSSGKQSILGLNVVKQVNTWPNTGVWMDHLKKLRHSLLLPAPPRSQRPSCNTASFPQSKNGKDINITINKL